MATANVLICGLGGLGVEVGECGCCSRGLFAADVLPSRLMR